MLHVNSRETTFEHQRVPAARFNNIFLKLFDRPATYCYIQVDLKSFLASGEFFLDREATERATISQEINSRRSSYLTVNQETNTTVLFSAYAIQPDLHVIRSWQPIKITLFFRDGLGIRES